MFLQGGRSNDESDRDRKLHSSTARGLQGTTTAGRVRSDQVPVSASPGGEYGSK